MNRRTFLSGFATAIAALSVGHLPTVPHRCVYPEPKIELIKALLANSIQAHDDLIEQAIFTVGSKEVCPYVYDY